MLRPGTQFSQGGSLCNTLKVAGGEIAADGAPTDVIAHYQHSVGAEINSQLS